MLAASIAQYILAPNYTFHTVLLFPLVLMAVQLAALVACYTWAFTIFQPLV